MATATLFPDGDITAGWGRVMPVGGAHYAAISEGADAANPATWLESKKAGEVDRWSLSASPANVLSVSAVKVNVRARFTDARHQMRVRLELFHTTSTQVGGPLEVSLNDLGGSGVSAKASVEWTGLSLTKAQADSLEVQATHL